MQFRAVVIGLALTLTVFAQEAELRRLTAERLQTALESSDYDEVVEAYESAIELAIDLDDPPLELARLHMEYGEFLDGNLDESERAAEQYRQALRLRRDVSGAELEVAESLVALGEAVWYFEDAAEPLKHFSEAAEIRTELLGPAHEKTRETGVWIGELHASEDRWPQASTAFRRVLAATEKEFGEAEDLAHALDAVAAACLYSERDKQVLALRKRALGIRESIHGSDSVEFAKALHEMASELSYASQDPALEEEAQKAYRRAIDILSSQPEPDAGLIARSYSSLAASVSSPEEKERLVRRAIELRDEAEIRDMAQGNDYCDLGDLLMEGGEEDEGIGALESCLQIRRDLHSVDSYWVEMAYTDLGAALVAEARYGEAQDLLRSRIDDLERVGEGSSWDAADAYGSLGDLLLESGDAAGAVVALERSVEIAEETLGPDNYFVMERLESLSNAYTRVGRHEDAQEIEVRMLTWTASTVFSKDFMEGFGTSIGSVLPQLALLGLVVVGSGTYVSFRLARRSSLSEAKAAAGAPPLERPDHLTTFTVALDQHRFGFHGQGGELFGIWIVNVLKTIVTLGVYYFWGKVKVRRYLWSHAEFSGDRFAFHGTPMELFVGWLKASPLLVFLLWGPQIALLAGQSQDVSDGLAVLAVGLFTILWPIAELGAHRYRLTRTSWRGVRFSFHGRSWKYFTIYLLSWPLWLLTLGLWTPFFNALTRRYVVNHMRFGDSDFECDAEGSDMLGPYFLNWLLYIPTLGIYHFWYTAFRERYYWSRTTFRGARFRSTISGGQLFALGFAGGILTLMTLGLASPWVRCWRMQVWLDSLHVDGDLGLDQIRQQEQDTTATAEGVADFFGLDFGFFE